MDRRDNKEFHRQDNSHSEDDSSSSEDDENAELLTEEVEEGFFKVLSQLKKKDLKLYKESVRFFNGNSSEGDALPGSNTGKTKKKSQKEYRDWLKGQKEKVESEEVKQDLEALHDFWTSPTLNKDEQFLRDYILNKKFLEPDDSFNIEEELNKLSDEEREVEEQILFEHKYNCRFENSDQVLVLNNKSKTKRKKNKASTEVPVGKNDDISPNSETVESNEEETKIKAVKKNKKRKRNKQSVNNIFEETEENTKIKNFTKKKVDKETSTEAKHTDSENIKDISQMDTKTRTGKRERRKSFKRKRNNNVQKNEDKSILKISTNGDKNQSEMLHPKKKSKKKINVHNIEGSGTKEMRGNVHRVLPEEQKQMKTLPRNLQMKNKKGVIKLRHRNRKKDLSLKTNKGMAEHTDGKIKGFTAGINHKKKGVHNNGNNKYVSGKKKQNNYQTKKTTHFQNLIVKEKKNKASKFSKMLSKKTEKSQCCR